MRRTIQSSSTPISGVISELGTTRLGSALPSPTIPARISAGAVAAATLVGAERHARAPVVERDRARPLDVARHQPREDLVGTDVDEALGALSGQPRHRLAPADRAGQGTRQLVADVDERLRRQPGEHGDRRLADRDTVERRAERRLRRRHPRRVKRPGDVERERPHTALAGDPGGGAQAGARSGEHGLARGVVVGHPHAGRRRDLGGGFGRALQQRQHAAVAARASGLIHQPPAQHHETQRVLVAQRAGGRERRELAERMAGEGDRRVGALEPAERREARQEDRRLGEARRIARAREAVLADQLPRPGEQLRQDALDVRPRALDRHPLAREQHR